MLSIAIMKESIADALAIMIAATFSILKRSVFFLKHMNHRVITCLYDHLLSIISGFHHVTCGYWGKELYII